jgi:flagellin
MASNITLSSAVRQNLLSLQNTAALSSLTQNRLATGKKVNSALDNPGNFFTSQSLNNRASDLNSLLDSIGQAQQTLKAADQGITSVTKLVESAKSIAKQARQAPQAGSTTYNAVTVNGAAALAETLGTTGAGSAVSVANATSYQFTFDVAGGAAASTVSFTSGGAATYNEILTGLQSSFATALAAQSVTATDFELVADGAGIRVNAVHGDAVDFTTAGVSASITGFGASTFATTSLLDNASAGATLTVAVNGGANQVITLGTGLGQVSSVRELLDSLNTINGISATTNAGALRVTLNSTSSQNTLTMTASDAGLVADLGLAGISGTTYQGTGTVGAPNATRTSLQSDFNNILTQIDALSKDASYNGVNLLDGDDLKVVFNETGSSFLTINGVTFSATGLGLNPVAGAGFQSDGDVETTIAAVDAALKTLRTQASAFGANLTTVQTRQDFTKNLINTLQTGADNLVLADTNEEGANMLALQTRQQLSTTALSLSAQADQAVLRLFG